MLRRWVNWSGATQDKRTEAPREEMGPARYPRIERETAATCRARPLQEHTACEYQPYNTSRAQRVFFISKLPTTFTQPHLLLLSTCDELLYAWAQVLLFLLLLHHLLLGLLLHSLLHTTQGSGKGEHMGPLRERKLKHKPVRRLLGDTNRQPGTNVI